MAETVLGMVQASLTSMLEEAKQAIDNKEALLRLASKANGIISPQLMVVQSKLAAVTDEKHLEASLTQLRMTLLQVKQLIMKRGRKRSLITLPLDAFQRRASKVQAEIQGAEQSLRDAMLAVLVGLQIQAVDGIENLREKFDSALGSPAGPSSGQQVQQQLHPWALDLKDLQYPQTRRGKPVQEIVLGSGGFGQVFRAEYQGKVQVAVKEPHNPSDVNLQKAFFREAHNLYRLQHRNVVEFIGAIALDEDGHACYMSVFEILPQTLESFLQSLGSCHVERKLRLILGMAEGLSYLHSMRIVHRDIKPQNIMVDAQATPKYIDFGFSKQNETLQSPQMSRRTSVTEDWMAPEEKLGENSTSASDVFSFGLVGVYVLLGGEKPPKVQSEREKVVALGHGEDLCGRLVLCCTVDDGGKRPTAATVAASLLIKPDIFSSAAAQPIPTASVDLLGNHDTSARNAGQEKDLKGVPSKQGTSNNLLEEGIDCSSSCSDEANPKLRQFRQEVVNMLASAFEDSEERAMTCQMENFLQRMDFSDPDVIVAELRCLRTFAGLDETCFTAVQDYKYVLRVQKHVQKVTQAGGIDVLVTAMRKHEDHEWLQVEGLQELLWIAEQGDENADDVVRAGGITVVVTAMSKHKTHTPVQTYGCSLLWTLSDNHQESVVGAGAIDLLLSAMRNNEGCAEVQTMGCHALKNLAVEGVKSVTVNVLNAVKVLKAGGIDVVVTAMQNHEDHVEVQESGCALLLSLVSAENGGEVSKTGRIGEPHSSTIIPTSDVLKVLVKVLRSDNQTGAISAAAVMWSLCTLSDTNKQSVADAGAIPDLITLLYCKDSRAQSNAAGTLAECSIRNRSNKLLIADHGAFTPLIKLLSSQDLSVQTSSATALGNVVADVDRNKKHAREMGALPVLVHVLSTSQVPEVLSPVVATVHNLSHNCPENKVEFVALGAREVLGDLVASSNPSLKRHVLVALEQLEPG